MKQLLVTIANEDRSLIVPCLEHLVLQVHFGYHVLGSCINQVSHDSAIWTFQIVKILNHGRIRLGAPLRVHEHLLLAFRHGLILVTEPPTNAVPRNAHGRPLNKKNTGTRLVDPVHQQLTFAR